MKVIHNSWNTEYRMPFGALELESVVRLGIDINDLDVDEVYLCLNFDGNNGINIKMTNAGKRGDYIRFSYSLILPSKPGVMLYWFKIITSNGILYYGNNADNNGGCGEIYESEPPAFQITIYKKFNSPKWFKDGIVYQIFPDRFNRDSDWLSRANEAITLREETIAEKGNPEIQHQFIEEDWEKPAYYIKDDTDSVTEWPFYGGSLKGIEDKLDYLKSLGVSVIYLNPIFEAVSNHRYDTADYFRIDPILGNEDDFIDLAKKANEKGISIVLDGVFSHTGADSVYFDKYGNYGSNGAFNNKNSKFRYWYDFNSDYKCGYKSWWGVKDLPEVDENNILYRQMICGKNGVLKKWIDAGARGWRLDVADELPDSFIKDIRKSIKEIDEDNVLIGEVWEDASNKISYNERRKYLMGEELDSTMNYPLRSILLDYINYTITSTQASDKIMSIKENYPQDSFFSALNILDSHDRERILTSMAVSEDYTSGVSKLKILTTLQYCLPGVPCIYYGDEAGMTGSNDPSNRSCFPWGKENKEISYHYRMLGLLYDQHPVLKDGDIELLSGKYDGITDDVFAFTRFNEKEKILVLVNRSYGTSRINLNNIKSLKGNFVLDLLTSKEVHLGEMTLEPLSCKIILIKDNYPKPSLKTRRAGVICHISSIPGGTLGKPARDFVDWLYESGLSVWQVLPLNPNGIGNCPYNSYATFAGNPDFIKYDELPDMKGFKAFYDDNKFWLTDYVDFYVTHNYIAPANLESFKKKLIYDQYYFASQWDDLKKYANTKGIKLMGDLPMYVSPLSSDVIANKNIFHIDKNGKPQSNAGVPSDGFNDDGQNWGLALYNWEELKKQDYDWWIKRINQCADRFDILRFDHFRGFSEYFAIPESGKPQDGLWQHGPGIDFFEKVLSFLKNNNKDLEIVAEDLGSLDNGVLNLIKLTGFCGMNIWQFSSDEMIKMPYEEAINRVFYTGTHDNQTLIGYLKNKYPERSKYDLESMALDIIRTIFKSPAKLAIIQLQDMFLLDDTARMNIPGVAEGNWEWKLDFDSMNDVYPDRNIQVVEWYRDLCRQSNR